MKLFEKYRPESLDDVKGQGKAVSAIRNIFDCEGWGGQCWYLSGASGTGKTTLARIVAKLGADNTMITEMDAADLTVETVRGIAQEIKTSNMFGGRCWIINEAHLMRGAIISKMLVLLEEFSERGRDSIIFTTTSDGLDLFGDNVDAKPFASRCNMIELQEDVADDIKEHILHLAGLEGIPMTLDAAQELVAKVGNNFRAAIQGLARLRGLQVMGAVA